ncbi:MAG: hypothetical protein Q8N23_18425 [Archangium sp.]|nr:hypothetical protein [Archangium sp.]MDP3572711.1 hypothetical protein [Archangium sp.]
MRWLLLGLILSGCTKCGGSAVDAGVDAGARVRRSTDLRNALIQSYPEYRDTALLDSRVRVTRTIPGLTPASRDEALAKLRWAVSDAGSGWDLNTFHLEQTAPETLVLSLPLSVEDVGHLYLAPAGLSSMEMSMYLPRQLPIGKETFELDLHYSSSSERCVIRVRQAVTLLVANGQWRVTKTPPEWSPDAAGDDGLPEAFSVEVTGTDGARIRFDRERGQVRVNYALVTVE